MSTTQRSALPAIALTVLAIAGCLVSLYLTHVHIDVALVGSSAGGLCNFGERLNCDGAASSSFSAIFGVPIAALGFGLYAGTAMVAIGAVMRPDNRGGTAAWLVLVYWLAVAYSVFLAVVSVVVIRSICPACLALYVINVLSLITAAAWLRGGAKRAASLVKEHPPVYRQAVPWQLLIVSVVGAAALTAYTHMQVAPLDSDAPVPLGPQVSADILLAVHAPTDGPDDAAVTIVEFSDFQCPYCARLVSPMHSLRELYPDDVRIVFRHFPLDFHEHADGAARAGVCAAEQDEFWAYHDAMFSNQGRIDRDGLIALADETGLNVTTFEACLDSNRPRALVDADLAAGDAAGVPGTPCFFINGVPYAGAFPVEALVPLIERALDR